MISVPNQPKRTLRQWTRVFLILLVTTVFPLLGQEAKKDPNEKPASGEVAAKETAEEKRRKQLDMMKSHIRYGSMKIRVEGIKKIQDLKEDEQPEFIAIINDLAVTDLDPVVRKESIRILGEVGTDATDPTLEKGLDDSNFEVRETAVRALGNRDYRASAPKLFQLLQKEDFEKDDRFTLGLIDVLSRFEYNQEAKYFEEKVKDRRTHPDVRRKIILYFGKSKADSAGPYLLELAKNEDEGATDRAYAVNSLGKLKYMPALTPFQEMLKTIQDLPPGREKNELIPLKMHLIGSLVMLGDTSVYPLIVAAAKDESTGVRLRAIRQMGELKMADYRDLLEYKSKYDENAKVRKEAQKSLDLIDGKTDKTEEPEEDTEGDS